MKKKIILIVTAIIIAIFIIKTFIPTEKDCVKKSIESLKNAVEKKNKIETLKYIDETYKDKNNMTSEQLINIIDEFSAQCDSIKISISNLKINIDSTGAQNTIFASCSLGLKIFARQAGDRILVFGGIIKPAPVRAYFKKCGDHYKVYYAEY